MSMEELILWNEKEWAKISDGALIPWAAGEKATYTDFLIYPCCVSIPTGGSCFPDIFIWSEYGIYCFCSVPQLLYQK